METESKVPEPEQETIITIIFRKLQEFVHHVHTTNQLTPLMSQLRDFMNQYTTVPIDISMYKELIKRHVKKTNSGHWFQSRWKSNTIMIKTQASFNLKTVLQVFIQYVIINQLELMYHPITYGFFWIGHNSEGTLFEEKGEQRFCLVQRHITGKLFSECKDITLTQFKHYCLAIYKTIETLLQSPYKVCYNSLHPRNVMITPEEHVVLINFKRSSFTVMNNGEEIRIIQHKKEEDYYQGESLVPCVQDAIHWYVSCCQHPVDDIALFSFLQVQKLYQFFWRDEDMPIHVTPDWLRHSYERRWLFHVLDEYESVLEPVVRKRVHHHNMTILKMLTTVWLVDFMAD